MTADAREHTTHVVRNILNAHLNIQLAVSGQSFSFIHLALHSAQQVDLFPIPNHRGYFFFASHKLAIFQPKRFHNAYLFKNLFTK